MDNHKCVYFHQFIFHEFLAAVAEICERKQRLYNRQGVCERGRRRRRKREQYVVHIIVGGGFCVEDFNEMLVDAIID